MNNLKYILVILIIPLLITSCFSDEQKAEKRVNKQVLEEALVKVNRKYVDVENQQIDDFMNRRNWTGFTKTKSGLRYYIYQKGIGKTPVQGSMVGMEYTISDIKGNVLYNSKDLDNKVFQVDKNEEPQGLNEAIKLIKLGAKVKLVVPSYLAYGLLGDDDKIGQKLTLIYDIYLVEVK